MLTPAEADQLIEERLAHLPVESLALAHCAGAVLRENVYAERDQPPFDRVAMDGIAIHTEGLGSAVRTFRIQATQAAGEPPLTLEARTACIEVMTGAVLPSACDAVIPIEQISIRTGAAELAAGVAVQAWQNVHRRGTDARQGALLLTSGMQLGGPEIAVAASAGMARIRVSRQPAVMVISTGNELVEPGEPILPHQVRRSNAHAVVAALRRQGFQRIADDHVADDAAALRRRIKSALDTHDVLILSGGVSMGKMDFVPQTLQELGVDVIFHRVAHRPGKPLLFGIAPSGAAVFALPGNPVSTLVCLARYVVPALFGAMGRSPRPATTIALGATVKASPARAFFLPVRVEHDDSGRAWAVPCPTNGSGDLTSLAGTDGFVELPPGPDNHPRGFVTRLYRW